MHKLFLLLIVGLIGIATQAQTYSINGTISGEGFSNIYLLRIMGEKQIMVDTTVSATDGSFTFELDDNFPVGMYLIAAGAKQKIEIIYNKENIRLISSGLGAEDNVQIIESIENLIWYDYLFLKGLNQYKMEVIETVLMNYPPQDEYYNLSQIKYKQLQQSILDRSAELYTNNPNTIAARFIKVDRANFAPSEFSDEEKQKYLIKHHFDNTDFSDTLLLRGNILTSKIVQYLSLYQKPGMSQEELEDRLIIAIDTVLLRATEEQHVYESIVEFLIKGFEAIGFEKGLTHIAEQNQLAELCVNSERKAELENKMELIKKLAIGKIAPNFSVNDINGKSINLNDINSEKTILIFWASWCPHCMEIMPVLQEYYNNSSREKINVIAISVDSDEDSFKEAIDSHKLTWINIAELKGWDGQIVLDYGISATPSIFVLDSEKKIIAKPTNKAKLNAALGN